MYEGLGDEENAFIEFAREHGYAECFPWRSDDRNYQGQATLKGSRSFLKELAKRINHELQLQEKPNMKTYLTTDYSPSMQERGIPCLGIVDVTESEFKAELFNAGKNGRLVTAVDNKDTAKILSMKMGMGIKCSQTNITLQKGDVVLCAIPQTRAPEGAREFTDEEVAKAEYRYFYVEC